MNKDRRSFIKWGGSIAAGLAFAPAACKLMSKDEEKKAAEQAAKKDVLFTTFSLQLYTLRDDLPADPKGILKQVAGFGYKQLEGYEGKDGMFWGMGHKGFKSYMDELGLDFVASHCDINTNFEQKAAEAAEIGMKYLICPWLGPQKSLDDYKRFAEVCNQKGEICKKNGIRYAYHNHDYTFKEMDGQVPQELLMQNTDASLVDFEMDIYWVVTGGHDAEAWMKKHKNRFRLCHVKDRAKGATEAADSCTLGEGSIDFPTILKTAKDNGMQYFIVEQEKYAGTTPLKAVEANAAYMKKLAS
ncbi:MAG: sugar phosphate isomerase/epimerase [Chitinophagaceae bacterium]|nr:sugar phosphate isomerase/epimerase [Chitinophagaceae bacterium]